MIGDRGNLLLKRNGKIKKDKIKFLLFALLGLSLEPFGFIALNSYTILFLKLLIVSIMVIGLIISIYSLMLSYVSRPFMIFDKGITYPAPPQAEWTVRKGIKYSFVRFNDIKEIQIQNDVLMKIIFKKDDKDLNIYLKYINDLDKELLIQTLKKSSLEGHKIVE